jgi:prevent-host-death family protein
LIRAFIEELGMVDLVHGIDSLANFKRRTPEMLDQLEASGDPLILTVNGRAKLVVQDASAYQKLLEKAEQADMIIALQEAIASMERGEGEEFGAAMKKLRRKHKIPRKP